MLLKSKTCPLNHWRAISNAPRAEAGAKLRNSIVDDLSEELRVVPGHLLGRLPACAKGRRD